MGIGILLTGLDIEVKAERYLEQIFHNLGGREQFEAVDVQLIRSDNPDGDSNEGLVLRCASFAVQPTQKVGRLFHAKITELSLATIQATQEGEIPSAVAAALFTGRR